MKALILATLATLSLSAFAGPDVKDGPLPTDNYLVVSYPRHGVSRAEGDNDFRSSRTVLNVTRIVQYNMKGGLIDSVVLNTPIDTVNGIAGQGSKVVSIHDLSKIAGAGGSVFQIGPKEVAEQIGNWNSNNAVEMSDEDLKHLHDDAVAKNDWSHYEKMMKGLTSRSNWETTDTADRLQAALKRTDNVAGAENVRKLLEKKLRSSGKLQDFDALSIKESIKPMVERATVAK